MGKVECKVNVNLLKQEVLFFVSYTPELGLIRRGIFYEHFRDMKYPLQLIPI